MSKKSNRTIKCAYCGREFIKPIPHICNKNYRKRKLKWINLMEEDKREQFNAADFVSNEKTPVETRDKRKVTIISTERILNTKRIVGDIQGDMCRPGIILCDWYKDGHYYNDINDDKDLFFSIKKKTRRMTNRELAWWLMEHSEEHREVCQEAGDCISSRYSYWKDRESCSCPDTMFIRRNGGEWKEPLIEE